jgi:hypothetical protein
MLPSALSRLKNRLEAKVSLTDEQRLLLAELRTLEADPRVTSFVTEDVKKSITATRILSGPGTCECCGR